MTFWFVNLEMPCLFKLVNFTPSDRDVRIGAKINTQKIPMPNFQVLLSGFMKRMQFNASNVKTATKQRGREVRALP